MNVVALDPMLQAGATIALHGRPDVTAVRPDHAARVTVLLVDAIAGQVSGLLRTLCFIEG